MANLRAIRTRIKSVENTRQITKSMKMVAAAKLRKTQAAFAGLRGYADSCGALLEEASAGMRADSDSPYLKPPAGQAGPAMSLSSETVDSAAPTTRRCCATVSS